MTVYGLRCWVAAIVLLSFADAVQSQAPTAESMALKMLDSEALYTVTGGLKPVSEGFWQTRFPEAQDTSPDVDAARAALATLPLGPDFEAGVYVFAAPSGGKRSASAFVSHKPSLRAIIARRWDVFEPLGVTLATPPKQVLESIDRAPRSARWRGFGLVFGYPDYAVEFFVEAGEKQADTNKFVERDFVNLPTYATDRGRFVYAVPKGHIERAEDKQLKAITADIIVRYREWRKVYLDEQNSGAVALLRAWLAPRAICYSPPEKCMVTFPLHAATFLVCLDRSSSCDELTPRVRCRLLRR